MDGNRGGNKGWMDGWMDEWMEIGEGIGGVDLGPLSLFFSKWRKEPAAEGAVLHVLFFPENATDASSIVFWHYLAAE